MQNSENVKEKDSSVKNPSANVLNEFPNSRNLHHAAVPPDVSSLSGNSFPKMMRETSSGEKLIVVRRGSKKFDSKDWINFHPYLNCFRCGKRGHIASACGRKSWYFSKIHKTCYNCGTRGHIAAACAYNIID